jgi:hypothetical protein
MQRSGVRGVGNWGILGLQILICAIMIIIGMRQIFYVNDQNSLQKMKGHSKRNCQHMMIRSVIHCVENFSEGMRPALQLGISTLRFFFETRQVPGYTADSNSQ